jgi:hypothetical protein
MALRATIIGDELYEKCQRLKLLTYVDIIDCFEDGTCKIKMHKEYGGFFYTFTNIINLSIENVVI